MKSREQINSFYNDYIFFKFPQRLQRNIYDTNPMHWTEKSRIDEIVHTQFELSMKLKCMDAFKNNSLSQLPIKDQLDFSSIHRRIIDDLNLEHHRLALTPAKNNLLNTSDSATPELPNDVLREILNHLRLPDIAAMRSVCKQYKNVIDNMPLQVLFYIPKSMPELTFYILDYKYPELLEKLLDKINNSSEFIINTIKSDKKLELSYQKPLLTSWLYNTDFYTIYRMPAAFFAAKLLAIFYASSFLLNSEHQEYTSYGLNIGLALVAFLITPFALHYSSMDIAASLTANRAHCFFKKFNKNSSLRDSPDSNPGELHFAEHL